MLTFVDPSELPRPQVAGSGEMSPWQLRLLGIVCIAIGMFSAGTLLGGWTTIGAVVGTMAMIGALIPTGAGAFCLYAAQHD